MTDPVATRCVGTRVPRVKDTRPLTGHGTVVDDVSRPEMLHGCFIHSPFTHARICGIDVSAALELPGVHAVFTAADLDPDVREAWHAVADNGVPDRPRPPLAEGEAKFVGDPVALVVAKSHYIAEDAIELVDVDYEPLPALADFTKAQDTDVVVHEAYSDNVALECPQRRRTPMPRTSSAPRKNLPIPFCRATRYRPRLTGKLPVIA